MSDNFLDRIPPGVIKGGPFEDPDAKVEPAGMTCPWCQAEIEDEDDFKIHVKNQHPEAEVDEDAVRRLMDYKAGKTDVIDI